MAADTWPPLAPSWLSFHGSCTVPEQEVRTPKAAGWMCVEGPPGISPPFSGEVGVLVMVITDTPWFPWEETGGREASRKAEGHVLSNSSQTALPGTEGPPRQ